MKLSRIIELALVRHYGPEQVQDQFLCNAVDSLRLERLITLPEQRKATKLIQGLLLQLFPEQQLHTLVDALYRIGRIPHKEIYANMPYTTQLYVWWVFDLKRKGL